MLRLLRWGTFIVLILVIVGVAFSYPLLRERFFGPMLAAQSPSIEIAGNVAAATIEATSTLTPTARPTLTATSTSALPSLVIIEPTAATATPLQEASTATPTSVAVDTPTPAAIATTSLLPPVSQATEVTPTVVVVVAPIEITPTIGTPTPTPLWADTSSVTTSVVIIEASPTATMNPNPVQAVPPAIGEKGWQPPLESSAVATEAITPTLVQTMTVTPIVVTTYEVTPSTRSADVTPILAITVELTPPLDTPTPISAEPSANTDSPLYGGPDFTYAILGQVTAGEPLTIIGWYTEGTWYLLANGLWLPGAAVDNAPLLLPLVFPTSTPIPTNTPTITPTPLPTATLVGSPTPTPTATSLDSPVCDCSADTYDCLGNIFATRSEAQLCFEYCFRQTGLDIHLLDPNLNGMACENLP